MTFGPESRLVFGTTQLDRMKRSRVSHGWWVLRSTTATGPPPKRRRARALGSLLLGNLGGALKQVRAA
jgi:hypothetical protein